MAALYFLLPLYLSASYVLKATLVFKPELKAIVVESSTDFSLISIPWEIHLGEKYVVRKLQIPEPEPRSRRHPPSGFRQGKKEFLYKS